MAILSLTYCAATPSCNVQNIVNIKSQANPSNSVVLCKTQLTPSSQLSFSSSSYRNSLKPLNSSLNDEQGTETTSSSPVAVSEKQATENEKSKGDLSEEGDGSSKKDKPSAWDWDDVQAFWASMRILNLSRQIRELEGEIGRMDDDPFDDFLILNKSIPSYVEAERKKLEELGILSKALDINKVRSCFGYDTFFATEVQRYEELGAKAIGNLRRPIEDVLPVLEKKISETVGSEVVLRFMEEYKDDITRQVCVVQPKFLIDLQFESPLESTSLGYVVAVTSSVATFGTIAFMGGSFLKPDATVDDYLASFVPLFGGFISILGVSEIATRVTAARYGVKLSPSFLLPSIWTGCLGVINNFNSQLPNTKALFDIPVARTVSAYLTSLVLVAAAIVANGSFNGADNALYITPDFFHNNPLLSFIQLVIGPYRDDFGNVLPYEVEGVSFHVDPLAFSGLIGMVVTSLNLLPFGKLEGGRIAQAMLGRRVAEVVSTLSVICLWHGAFNGSSLSLAWVLFISVFRSGEESPATDEITPLESDRLALGTGLALICFFTLFPANVGTLLNSFFSGPLSG